MIALIIAGGSGVRLWPISQEDTPKQLHTFVGDKSLIKMTIERLEPLIEPNNIWIVTGENYAGQMAQHALNILPNQIIAEPFPVGTNLAVGIGAIHIAQKHPDAIIVVGWVDSYIGKKSEFHNTLQKAALLASVSDAVLLSNPIKYPSTSYGYIKTGQELREFEGVFKIAGFEEKPNIHRAQELSRTSSYYWNTGISVWRVSSLLSLLKKYQPEHYTALEYVSEAIGTPQVSLRMREAFKDLDRISIDQAIFEKATNMLTIPIELDWNDIGSWANVYDIQSQGSGNVTRGSVVSIDTDKCLIYSQKRLIATLGVSD